MRPILFVLSFVLTCLAGTAGAQNAPLAVSVPGQPPAVIRSGARAEDLSSPDALLKALYEVISGPKSQARDWERFRNLFVPGARLIVVVRPPQGPAELRMLTPDEYVERATPVVEKTGFFERELARREMRYGALLQAFSTYASYRNTDDAQPYARGINSIQLFHDGTQWRVVTVYWDAENADRPLPAEYLPH